MKPVVLFLAMAGLVAWRAARGMPVAPLRWLRDLGIRGALLLAPAVLVCLPCRAVQQEMGLRRSLENWAVTPGSFLEAPTHLQTALLSWLPGPRILDTASAYLFPGFLPLLLAAASLAAAVILLLVVEFAAVPLAVTPYRVDIPRAASRPALPAGRMGTSVGPHRRAPQPASAGARGRPRPHLLGTASPVTIGEAVRWPAGLAFLLATGFCRSSFVYWLLASVF